MNENESKMNPQELTRAALTHEIEQIDSSFDTKDLESLFTNISEFITSAHSHDEKQNALITVQRQSVIQELSGWLNQFSTKLSKASPDQKPAVIAVIKSNLQRIVQKFSR